jgi:hypothetical protein
MRRIANGCSRTHFCAERGGDMGRGAYPNLRDAMSRQGRPWQSSTISNESEHPLCQYAGKIERTRFCEAADPKGRASQASGSDISLLSAMKAVDECVSLVCRWPMTALVRTYFCG